MLSSPTAPCLQRDGSHGLFERLAVVVQLAGAVVARSGAGIGFRRIGELTRFRHRSDGAAAGGRAL
jgi:hypothetical protein